MDKEKLNDILQKHKKWFNDEDGGERADLRGANLEEADLRGADLRGVDLKWADLSHTELGHTDLTGADLKWANLSGADLKWANLSGVNLSGANLSGANLSGASLRGANLSDADLRGANLSGASLINARNLDTVLYNEYTSMFALNCPEKGSFTAFKKIKNNLIVELKIPAKAKRSSATTRKCRASEAKVVKIWNYKTNEVFESGVSQYDSNFIYEVGKTVKPTEKFNEDRWDECASGIHFFMTLQEAIDY